MSVLVTGGAGYIGSHMAWTLIENGDKVVVLDRLSTGNKSLIPPGVDFYCGDISNRELLLKIFEDHEVTTIIHFAGSVVVPESVSDPLGYYDNNTCRTRILIDAAVEAGIRYFVFSSTAAVYETPISSEPVAECSTLNPSSPYGMSKLMTERMLKDTSVAHNFSYTALRYFNVAGADIQGRSGQTMRGATHLIKVACETALGKRPSMKVFGTDYATPDGTCVRDFIHVNDLVDVHLKALQRMQRGGTSIVANCGYGQGYSVKQVIERLKEIAGSDFIVEYADRRPGDAVSIVADASLARAEFNWCPRYDDLSLILETALRWEAKLP